MTVKVYEFNELDPNFWIVWIGQGQYNLYDVSEGKFKFTSAYRRQVNVNYVVLRTSRVYSFINNGFSVDFNVTNDSLGRIAMICSPEKLESGDAYLSLKNGDGVGFYFDDEFTLAEAYRIRDGGMQFLNVKPYPATKRSGTISMVNSHGKVAFYVDNDFIAEYPEAHRYGYIYLSITPLRSYTLENRMMSGWFDNFKILDYETALINPDLSALIPTLNQMTQSTLMLVATLSLVGAMKGMVGAFGRTK